MMALQKLDDLKHHRCWRVLHDASSTVLAEKGDVALSLTERLLGLLSKSKLEQGQALIIHPCDAIHMWGMTYSIDVVFIDADCRVTAWEQAVSPWGVSRGGKHAAAVIELPENTLNNTQIKLNDCIRFESD